jgi:hypothetical protein
MYFKAFAMTLLVACTSESGIGQDYQCTAWISDCTNGGRIYEFNGPEGEICAPSSEGAQDIYRDHLDEWIPTAHCDGDVYEAKVSCSTSIFSSVLSFCLSP